MTSSTIRTLMFAGIAIALPALPALASVTAINGSDSRPVRAAHTQLALVQCMTDDGYGRKRPCSANYKKENPNWRSSDECMTDDGYGRLHPCSAYYKKKHAK